MFKGQILTYYNFVNFKGGNIMKKTSVLGIVLIFFCVFFASCAKKPAAPEAGAAKVNDMLSLIPKDVQAVFFADFPKVMSVEFMDESIGIKNYNEIVEEIGLDPKKDIYFIAGALSGGIVEEKPEWAVILNLKYDKETLLAKIKKEEEELVEEDYNGVILFSGGKEDDTWGAFLDDSNIVIGCEKGVKSTIDTYQKKAENVFKNESLTSIIKKTNKEAIFWASIIFTPETMKKLTSQNPMLSALEAVNAGSLYLDSKNENLIVGIDVMSPDESTNQQIAEALKGLKALGALAATENLDAGELFNKIEITSTADRVKIYASIPEELIKKLSVVTRSPPQFPEPSELSTIGTADYSWSYRALDGKEILFSESKGKVVFLNFWATWCGPCKAEMPNIQSLYDSLKNEDIVFLLVSNEDEETVRKFLDKKQYTFPVYLRDKEVPEVFKTRGIPATFILSREGSVVFKHVGAAKWDDESCLSFIRSLK